MHVTQVPAARLIQEAHVAFEPAQSKDFAASTRLGFALLIALVCLIGVGKAVNTTLDPDLFWHLRVADQLRVQGIHPLIDQISFASIRQPWTPYSWLAELGMKGVWDALGYRGTIIFQAIAIVGTVIFIARASAELAGPQRRLNAALATALAAYLALPYLSFRPATFAIFWLALCAWLLVRDRVSFERTRAVWLLVPVTALLANIHLLAVVVPIWIACLFAGASWERLQTVGPHDDSSRRMRRYAIMLVFTLIGCCATPLLPGVIATAVHYQFHDVMVSSGFITEMTPIYSGVSGALTTVLIAALIVTAWSRGNPLRAGDWIWLGVSAAMMLRLGRFAPIFAMVAAPLLASSLPKLSDVVLQRKPVLVVLSLVALIGTARKIAEFPRNASLAQFLDRDEVFRYPTAAADFVERSLPRRSYGRIITDFTWGGYVAWRLGDRYQVLLDGRTQLYSEQFWRDSYLGNVTSRIELLQRYPGDVAIVPLQRSIFKEPLERLGWRVIYSDDRAAVLAPTDSPNTAQDNPAPDNAS